MIAAHLKNHNTLILPTIVSGFDAQLITGLLTLR